MIDILLLWIEVTAAAEAPDAAKACREGALASAVIAAMIVILLL